ncbi:MAG TPA: hypothetical protein PLV88_02600, partial [Methanoregulaceae archaeon]|nr:hypothetical protein [Methanoregulaceae archaeon]
HFIHLFSHQRISYLSLALTGWHFRLIPPGGVLKDARGPHCAQTFFMVPIEWGLTFLHRSENSNYCRFSDVIFEKEWW